MPIYLLDRFSSIPGYCPGTGSVAKDKFEFLTLLPPTSKCSSMTSLANFAAVAAAVDSLLSSQPGLLKKIENV